MAFQSIEKSTKASLSVYSCKSFVHFYTSRLRPQNALSLNHMCAFPLDLWLPVHVGELLCFKAHMHWQPKVDKTHFASL